MGARAAAMTVASTSSQASTTRPPPTLGRVTSRYIAAQPEPSHIYAKLSVANRIELAVRTGSR